MKPFALVSGDFVPTGGMDMPNLALARYLAVTGHPVNVVAHRADRELCGMPGVRFTKIPKPFRSYFVGAPLLDVAGRWVGQRTLRAGGRVVVNGANCLVGDVNWVHYVHAAYDAPSAVGGWRAQFKHPLERRVNLVGERAALRRARFVVANSARTRQHLLEHFGLPPDRVGVVYYGIDAERFRPPTADERSRARAALGLGDQPVAVFVGALGDRRKGFDVLFNAWLELASRGGWEATLLVVGHGAELEAWRARSAVAKLERSIRYLGFRRDVASILRACDVLVAPARYEAFGQGAHEALCCGLPVLVAALAGVAEKLSPALSDLALRDVEDVGELASKLQQWQAARAAYGEAAVAHAATLRQRTWEVMASEFLSAIGEASDG